MFIKSIIGTKKDTRIVFSSEEYISPSNGMVKCLWNGRVIYFEIESINIYEDENLAYSAKQIGYHNQLHENTTSDLRHLIDSELQVVTVNDEIRKIREESTYC